MSEEQNAVAFHIIGDAFVDLFCVLSGAGLPEIGGDACLNAPVKTYAGGSAMNTATHLNSLVLNQSFTSTKGKDKDEKTKDKENTNIKNDNDENNVVHLHSVLNPDDNFGQILSKHVQRCNFVLFNCRRQTKEEKDHDEGVKEKGLKVSPLSSSSSNNSTGHCVAIVTRNERTFMTYRGCNSSFTPADLYIGNFFPRTTTTIDDSVALNNNNHHKHMHVHISGYFNLTGFWNGTLKDYILRLQTTARERNQEFPNKKKRITFSLVPQYDETKEWDGGIDDLIISSCLDFLIMNEMEATSIANAAHRRRKGDLKIETATEGSLPTKTTDEDESTINHWISTFSSNMNPTTCFVITRGSLGVLAIRGGKVIASQSTISIEKPVDTTGAGDAFSAGFLHGLWSWEQQRKRINTNTTISSNDKDDCSWSDQAIQEALLWGCSLGTSSVLTTGASNPSNYEQIHQFYTQIQDTHDHTK